ncbi:MAG: YbjN domain-containing protein, partial [Waterburya sp.]
MTSQVSNLEVDNTQTVEDFIEKESSHKEVIETVISSLDQNDTAMVNHTEQGSLWKFNYGSVEVFVQLTGETDDDLLTIWSSLLNLPAK